MSIDDDLEMIKFCPHMDWQTNRCSACRAYRLKVEVERLRTKGQDDRDALMAERSDLLAEIERLRAEVQFQRDWCRDNLGLMPPSVEQNAAFIRALDGAE